MVKLFFGFKMADYYKTLGIDKSASEKEIKQAYRKLALKYHPDRNKNNKAYENKFKEINEAYAVLSDKNKKKQYDMFGENKFHKTYSQEDIFKNTDFNSIFKEFNINSDFGDIFKNIFDGDFSHFQSNKFDDFNNFSGKRKLNFKININFEEAYNGVEKNIRLRSDNFDRQIKIKIPPGILSGTSLRITKYADKDIYIKVTVDNHFRYQRQGNDIITDLDLKLHEIILGTVKKVQTPQGIKTVKIPAGIYYKSRLRLKEIGFNDLKSGKRGDMYIKLNLIIPKNINTKQKEIALKMKELDI